MSTLEIHLPDEVKSLVDEQIARGRFADLSDCVAYLVRQDQHRLEQQHIEHILLQRIKSGPSAPMTDADFDAIRSRLEVHKSSRNSS